MKTDLPLKRLVLLRPADLLALLGLPAASVIEVSVPELPLRKQTLDTLLRVRSPAGQEYLIIIEWQGYRDRSILWRLVVSMGVVTLDNPDLPVIGIVIYLKPSDDMGNRISVQVDGELIYDWQIRAIRLWEFDAAEAAASGNLALMTLSPLMHGADPALIEQTALTLLRIAPMEQRADILTFLGIFAAPILDSAQFTRIVTKEVLMSSDLIEYLMQDVKAQHEQELQQLRQAMEATRREIEATQRKVESERSALLATLTSRFPDAPLTLGLLIQQIRDVQRLQRLRADLPAIPDLVTLEQRLRAEIE
jgi:hypothetical protein